jgi:hypothetical protein
LKVFLAFLEKDRTDIISFIHFLKGYFAEGSFIWLTFCYSVQYDVGFPPFLSLTYTLPPPPPPPTACTHVYLIIVVGRGGGRKSPSNKPPPPPSSIPPHIQLIGRNNKQQHTRTPNNRQQHTTTVDNSTLVDKNTNVPLFKKLFDIIFFGGENHFMSHFSGHFEGASTFLTPKLSLAALGTI